MALSTVSKVTPYSQIRVKKSDRLSILTRLLVNLLFFIEERLKDVSLPVYVIYYL